MELVKQIRDDWRSQTEVSEAEISNTLLEPWLEGERRSFMGSWGYTAEVGTMVGGSV